MIYRGPNTPFGRGMPVAWTGSIGITTPVAYQMHQRGTTTGSIAITGTYSGLVSGGIEASFNGGAYQTIAAAPTGGTYSGTLTGQAVGQGTLSVRFTDSHATVATKPTVGIGDIYLVIGDSNHSGRATTSTVQASSSNGLVGIEFGRDNTWKPHQESITTTGSFDAPNGQGSYFGALSTLIMNTAAVPVAFVPGAQGSTTLTQWSVVSNGNNPFWQYGAALTQAQGAGGVCKAVLCLLGTNVDALDATQSTDAYNAIINAYKAALGCKTVVYLAVGANAANNTAVANVLAGNADALAGPTFVGAWSGTHYLTASDINVAAGRAWTALQPLFYP